MVQKVGLFRYLEPISRDLRV